jgi:hypothetical protein
LQRVGPLQLSGKSIRYLNADSPLFSEERVSNLGDVDLEMFGNVAYDLVERSDSNSTMTGNNQMMLPVLSGSQPHMTALLPHNSVAEMLQCLA